MNFEIRIIMKSSWKTTRVKTRKRLLIKSDVIKDLFPQISVSNLKDSVLYKRIMLGGGIGDDYGISQLSLYFRIRDENQKRNLFRICPIFPLAKTNYNKISFTIGLLIL